MKTLLPALCRFTLCIFCVLITSCVMYDDGFNQPYYGNADGVYSEPYGNDYGVYDQPGYYGAGYPRNYGGFATGYYRGFGGGYRDSYCDEHGNRYPRSGGVHSYKDDGKVDRDNLRIVGGDLNGKVRPEGSHSADWYRSRGYNISKLKVEDEDGTRYKPSSTRSSPPPSGRPPPRTSSSTKSHSSDIKTVSSRSSGRPPESRSSSGGNRESSSNSKNSSSKSSGDKKENSGGISRKR